jgi:hypothetical protein
MDKEKRNRAEAVRRRLSRGLEPLGLRRTKTSFWTREREFVVEFIHLHLFTFDWSFRVHLGVRVLNDSFEAAALNGLYTPDGWYGDRPRYDFLFSDDEESVNRCADDLVRFVRDVASPWFERFVDPRALLTIADSPLTEDERTALAEALAGESAETRVAASRVLLGVAKPPAAGRRIVTRRR